MKIDIKSAIIGLLIGIIVMMAGGARNGLGGAGQIGFAVPSGSNALVKGVNGEAFVVNMNNLMAHRVLFQKPEPGESRYPNNINGRSLILAD